MTGEHLRSLREARGMTRDQLAAHLGDCTGSTINKWERNINPVPGWVAEKMLQTVKVSFPLGDLHQLLDLSRELDISFDELLAEGIQLVIASRREKPQAPTSKPGPTAAPAVSSSNITPMPVQHLAAEGDQPSGATILKPDQVNYESGANRKRKNK
jgi:transcriptional regulator with XRE-family HTH domain